MQSRTLEIGVGLFLLAGLLALALADRRLGARGCGFHGAELNRLE